MRTKILDHFVGAGSESEGEILRGRAGDADCAVGSVAKIGMAVLNKSGSRMEGPMCRNCLVRVLLCFKSYRPAASGATEGQRRRVYACVNPKQPRLIGRPPPIAHPSSALYLDTVN